MKARIIASVAAAGTLAIVACNQDLAKSPSIPTQASFTAVPGALTCSYPNMRTYAAAYLTDPRAVNELIGAMSRATGANINARGFDILTAIAAAADAGVPTVKSTATPTDGSNFANSVLSCMSLTGYTVPIDFSGALGTGIFEVRDNSGSNPVKSHLLGANGPAFGAEPSTGNWPHLGKTLFYGSLLNLAMLGNENSAGDNFELSTLPSGLAFSPEIKAGVCELTDPNGRILHLHASDPGVILPPVTDLSFCTGTTVSSGASTSLFASATSRLASWLAPSPANAAATRMFRAGGGGAGLVDGLSKIGPVTYTSTMAWVQTPGNTSRSKKQQFFPVVTVFNGSAGGNNLSGATITLVVSTNKGSFNVTGNVATTDATGKAQFPNLHIDKPGGYTVTAVSELGGSTSTFFNIDGH